MGWRNWQLLRDLETARQGGDPDAVARLSKSFEESQASCPHEAKDVFVGEAATEMVTSNVGPIQKGDTIVQCMACSHVKRRVARAAPTT